MRIIQFAAIILTALALMPSGAHLLELPNKIGLAAEDYFIVQQFYAGWAFLGALLFAELIADVVLSVVLRGRGLAFALAALAVLSTLGVLVVFFAWTYPANVATANWTSVPANWGALRTQWEYSHAVSAILTMVALCSLVGSTLLTARSPVTV